MEGKDAEVEQIAEETEAEIPEEIPAMKAKEVLYCGVCGLPAEYCEFGPDFNRCKPWLIEHCPEIYPSLIKKEGEEGEEKEGEGEEEEKKKSKRGGKGVVKADKGPQKGGKDAELTITTSQKKGKKIVTTVSGLKGYGVNLKDAASVFKKKFASGASVTKEGDVDIQGDLSREVKQLIVENAEWNIPRKSIKIVESTKKRH
ncbi:eukaryotic translation initiation factor SUI1 family protein [Acanthamoeba castellanii str. Neff]|uniref:Eukaryotic translation initiation factor SUI1 family protein n=1 Tax=Acanthamoeba castellanii (strain ATCC 30010 / Neff) TaxID=1257118 RepID=L8H1M7_ACACF|nr:eukaryotic translation initiation factor SUI1 family protein [Acanthamoeba castellanii str. Neff]ELR19102.1 eukaryotic translation initiation factor SUI1 family protein [Acanthamoeba castellanii str. Neff]